MMVHCLVCDARFHVERVDQRGGHLCKSYFQDVDGIDHVDTWLHQEGGRSTWNMNDDLKPDHKNRATRSPLENQGIRDS